MTLISSATLAHARFSENGVSYYSLPEIASKLKLKLVLNSSEEGVLSTPGTQLYFLKGKRYATLNNTQIWLGHPILFHKNNLYIAETDFSKAIGPVLAPNNYSIPPKLFHIVIDAGHGGSDEGASNIEYGLKEKDLTLDLSFRLMHELEQMGYKVTLTRNNDSYLPLKDRPNLANNKKADLFLSIHFNSVENGKPSVRGIETYVLTLQNHPSTSSHKPTNEDKVSLIGNENDVWNALLGYHIQSSLTGNLNNIDRGVRRARFAVLKTLNCPGALIEAGFLSHNDECQNIASPAYRQKIAQAIASGVLAYQKILNRINNH